MERGGAGVPTASPGPHSSLARMDTPSVMASAVLVAVLVGSIFLAFCFAKLASAQSSRRAAVRQRIRREVQEEFEQTISQSSGVRRWWLVLRREMEITRRAGHVIHGR